MQEVNLSQQTLTFYESLRTRIFQGDDVSASACFKKAHSRMECIPEAGAPRRNSSVRSHRIFGHLMLTEFYVKPFFRSVSGELGGQP